MFLSFFLSHLQNIMLICHFETFFCSSISHFAHFAEYRGILFGGGIVILAADWHWHEREGKNFSRAEKASFPFSITVWGTCDGLAHPSSLIPFIKETSVLSSISFFPCGCIHYCLCARITCLWACSKRCTSTTGRMMWTWLVSRNSFFAKFSIS